MDMTTLRYNGVLILTATIWGFAFVAQRAGMAFVGPFTFNGIRFALGALSLIPLMTWIRLHPPKGSRPVPFPEFTHLAVAGALTGGALFIGASLQQVGMLYTTAGKAGFITGLYVVIVPLLGLFWRQHPDLGTWLGAAIAAVGLYLLSVTEAFTIAFGDFLELIGAVAWAAHVLLIGRYSYRVGAIRLAFCQFVVCSALSLATALLTETITLDGVISAAVPILYGGVCSVGVAYTLQVVAQKHVKPAHAAIILCMESPFAALGGWLMLGEHLGARALVGCAFMLSGMLLSQLYPYMARSRPREMNATS